MPRLFLLPLCVLSVWTSAYGASRYDPAARTPYPLYAIEFGLDFPIDAERAAWLADGFEAYFGSLEIEPDALEAARKVRPDFQFIHYVGRWSLRGEQTDRIQGKLRGEVLYFQLGRLAEDLSPEATTLQVEDPFGTSETLESNPEVTAWLKLGDEWLRIIRAQGNIFEVERGWDGSVVAAHPSGTPVIAPVVGSRAPVRDGRLALRHDVGASLRWESIEGFLHERFTENQGAVWIDILIGNYASYAFGGELIEMSSGRQWNMRKGQPYSEMEIAHETEKAIHGLQESFFQKHGRYPVIWANNMGFPRTIDDPRLQLLLSSPRQPRPLDGFAMENLYAHYGYGGSSGKEFMWVPFDEWEEHVHSLMLMGELQVNARPLMFDGGIDNLKFAALPEERRKRLILYGYASYLLGVKVESDGRIYTKLGSCPMVVPETGAPSMHLYDCFTWDIGRPIETRKAEDFAGYKLEGRRVYLRRFENGIVLVNPTAELESGIDLRAFGSAFHDPSTGESGLNFISLEPRTGRILFHD